MKTALVIVIVLCMVCTIRAEIIPENRRTNWHPGVPGGIPSVTGPVVSIADHDADPTGKTDSKAAFVAAMDALPVSGGVVFIPGGDYTIGSTIKIARNAQAW
jgi:hypothetical protein